MAWYTTTYSQFANKSSSDQMPISALYKTIQSPLHDWNFRSICANSSTTCLFAHIRAATSTAITPTNNNPFVFGRHTIIHNGYVPGFSKIQRHESINGGTDSEHLAAVYMACLTIGGGKEGY